MNKNELAKNVWLVWLEWLGLTMVLCLRGLRRRDLSNQKIIPNQKWLGFENWLGVVIVNSLLF